MQCNLPNREREADVQDRHMPPEYLQDRIHLLRREILQTARLSVLSQNGYVLEQVSLLE